MRRSVLLVGLGQIGMGYDLEHDPRKYVFTHARAFSTHPAFDLIGAVDVSPEHRSVFVEKYGQQTYSSLGDAFEILRPDVVVVAAPTAMHAPLVKDVLQGSGVKAILCEKPLAYDLSEARDMVASCREAGVALFVNYMRRVDSGVATIKKMLDEGAIAAPIKGVAWYSKGFLHNGSHFFNLLEYWLGAFQSSNIIHAGRKWDDHDPEPDVLVRFKRGDVVFRSAWEEAYSHYTIELLSHSGRLRYEQGGCEILWQSTTADPQVAGYRVLAESQIVPHSMDRIQWHVADHLARHLSGEPHSLCTGEQALESLDAMHRIINQIK